MRHGLCNCADAASGFARLLRRRTEIGGIGTNPGRALALSGARVDADLVKAAAPGAPK
ncbi:hypothetical protein [Caballeronia telluris]|uniref:hypothetical protein n=1 Tax=Caballeronia telluris TaxID=326475 RepID=UPI00135C795B|nr:hypothetical protein [Caballeronia telluris]